MYRPMACSSLKWLPRPNRQTYQRTLFSFPNFSDLAPWNVGSETQTYHERKILPYSQKDLYQVVADVASYHRFIPFCTGSRIVTPARRLPHGTSNHSDAFLMEAELTVGFLAFQESYVSQVTCKPYEYVEAIASSSTPLFKTLTTTWHFEPASPKSPHPSFQYLPTYPNGLKHVEPTLVTLDLAYAFSNPLHASVSSTFFGQVSKLMVKAFEERCLEVYGPGADSA